MPIDFEMLLSASPPLYAYSAFVDSRYTRFTSSHCSQNGNYDKNFSGDYLNGQALTSDLQCSSAKSTFDIENKLKLNTQIHGSRQNAQIVSCNYIQMGGKLREKKRVSFADDKGLDLVQVRSIPETTHVTPKWTRSFLSFITTSIKTPEDKDLQKKWNVAFTNPIDPLEICEKLGSIGVSLESVVVEKDGITDTLTGKIAVEKTLQEKDVFMRITFDRWVTHEDIPAKYSISNVLESSPSENIWDIFHFSATIPQSATRYDVVEFCFCCRVNDVEHWDNNGGINYRIITTPMEKPYKLSTTTQVSQILSNNQETLSQFEPLSESFGSRSDIRAWESFLNDQPYW